MKILIVTQNFYPDNFQINDISQELVRQGHEVTVITGLPDYATNRVPKEYKFFRKHSDELNGVKIYRVPIFARRQGAIMRFLNYLSFAISGSIFCATKKLKCFDVIYVWETSPITMAIPGIVLKYRYKKPLFLYCLDLWPECMKAFRVQENNPVYRMVNKLCQWIFSKCDRVAVTSKPFFEYIEHVNKYPRDKMFYLPQYNSEDYLDLDFSAEENGMIDFLYAGNIGYAQNLHCIIEAVEKLRNEPLLKVHFVGDGSAKKELEELVFDKGLADKILFHGRVLYEEMKEYYKLADACLLTLDGSNKIGDTLPVKLQGYMAAGKVVIASINGAGKEVINDSSCGLCCNAGDSDSLAELMSEFIYHGERYSLCGNNGRDYFKKNFTKKQHFETLLKELEFLMKE